LFMDIDDFKLVNDSYGHVLGDNLLVQVAQRVRGMLRASDTAARLGGDEFAILLEGATDLDEACRVAQRVLDLSTRASPRRDAPVDNVSVGVAVSDGSHIGGGCATSTSRCTPRRRIRSPRAGAGDAGGGYEARVGTNSVARSSAVSSSSLPADHRDQDAAHRGHRSAGAGPTHARGPKPGLVHPGRRGDGAHPHRRLVLDRRAASFEGGPLPDAPLACRSTSPRQTGDPPGREGQCRLASGTTRPPHARDH
jgi:hypothetical protein